jgi:hypothetical protein
MKLPVDAVDRQRLAGNASMCTACTIIKFAINQ